MASNGSPSPRKIVLGAGSEIILPKQVASTANGGMFIFGTIPQVVDFVPSTPVLTNTANDVPPTPVKRSVFERLGRMSVFQRLGPLDEGAQPRKSVFRRIGPLNFEEEESVFALTAKGRDNNIMDLSPDAAKSKERKARRRRNVKKSTSRKDGKTEEASENIFESELVAEPCVPVGNSYSPLQYVRKNSPTAQLRRSWELPNHKRARPSIAQRKQQDVALNIYKVYAAIRKNSHGKKRTGGIKKTGGRSNSSENEWSSFLQKPDELRRRDMDVVNTLTVESRPK